MNTFRQELAELLKTVPGRRPAALRRSLEDGWLYATDLPQAADAAALSAFRIRAEALGWRTEDNGGWLQMTRPFSEPPEQGFTGPFGSEAGCCLSLLRRHRDRLAGEADQAQDIRIRLVKAGEEGASAYEKACRQLHEEWAARLRRQETIPDIDERYFRM